MSGSASFQSEEVLVSNLRFGRVTCQRIGTTKLEMGECTYRVANHNPAMIENFLELDSSFLTLVYRKIGFAPHVGGIESTCSQLIRNSNLQQFHRFGRLLAAQSEKCAERGLVRELDDRILREAF
jgi:hypothetical protein